MSDYTTLASVKARLVSTVTSQDAMLSQLITDASRAVDQWCNRPNNGFVGQAQTRVYDVISASRVPMVYLRDPGLIQMQQEGSWPSTSVGILDIDPLLSFSSVLIDQDVDGTFDTALTYMTDFDFKPQNAPADGEPWRQLRMLPTSQYVLPVGPNVVQIAGTWGESLSVPEPIRSATELTVIRWFKRPQDALDNSAKGSRQWNPDADVEAILRQGGFIKAWVIV